MGKPVPWTTSDILEATGGDPVIGNIPLVYENVSIDSREISEGDLFIAIRGSNHDGHDFIASVVSNNGKGFVVNKQKTDDISGLFADKQNISVIAVDDTVQALGNMAAFQRNRAGVKVVAITGSNGKTTTRGLSESVFKQKFSTLATRGNFNNEIGLPLTLLRLSGDNEWSVVELGMNRPGEIRSLARIASPDIGIITNISAVHLEGLGSIEGVMKAKAELLEEINSRGLAILNADDQRLVQISKTAQIDVLMYGFSEKAQVKAEKIKQKGYGSSFLLITPSGETQVEFEMPGEFMISNALAAAAAGHAAGMSVEEIKKGVESFQPEVGRMSIVKTQKGITIIDDTYNANPASMEAAISALCNLKGGNNGFLVAGDMLEMGEHAEEVHQNIGISAARSGIAGIYTTGKYSGDTASGASSEKMDGRTIVTGSKENILEKLKQSLRDTDWVLVKGSRAMGMETIVKELKKWGDLV